MCALLYVLTDQVLMAAGPGGASAEEVAAAIKQAGVWLAAKYPTDEVLLEVPALAALNPKP